MFPVIKKGLVIELCDQAEHADGHRKNAGDLVLTKPVGRSAISATSGSDICSPEIWAVVVRSV